MDEKYQVTSDEYLFLIDEKFAGFYTIDLSFVYIYSINNGDISWHLGHIKFIFFQKRADVHVVWPIHAWHDFPEKIINQNGVYINSAKFNQHVA